MKISLGGASSAALLLGIYSGLGAAWAQQTVTTSQPAPSADQQAARVEQTAPADDQKADRVIVTGSLIATTAENAPKPVEVYTADDLEAQGMPSASDFIRSLTVSASSNLGFGQSNPDVITGSGFSNVDMRGQGSNGSMVLFNGRRLASTNGGFGADINTIPTEALGSVEVLKDGASATYGAGAVGGVMNFTTRRDIDAPQVNFETTMYEGSKSYKFDFLTGWVGDSGNVLISASHFHEDPLEATEREFATIPYALNPAGYTNNATQPGRFNLVNNFYDPTLLTLTSTGTVNDYRGGAGTTTTAQGRADCQAVGGYIYGDVDPTGTDLTTVPKTLCGFNENLFNQLVSDQTLDKAYVEFNSDITDSMSVHVDGIWSKSLTKALTPPSPSASGSAIDASLGTYAIPVNVQRYNTAGAPILGGTTANPYMADFASRTGASPTAAGALIIPSAQWRPFFYGGNPAYTDDGRELQTYDRERFMVNAGINGDFTDDGLLKFLSGIHYDFNIQYNQYKDDRTVPAMFRSRVQNALLGYGGAGCTAVDRVATDYSSAAAYTRTVGIQSDTAPGTNGCQWLNPFASSFSRSIASGQTNPQYGGAAFDNSSTLAQWITQEDRTSEENTEAVTFDAVFTGTVPDSMFTLPGGDIGWAVGSQIRANERRAVYTSDNVNEKRMITEVCPWPDFSYLATIAATPGASTNFNPGASPTLNQRGCTSAQLGTYLTAGNSTTTNTGTSLTPDFFDSQTVAFFGELQLPILDNLNLSASLRNEDYNNGKIAGTIYSVAGKYDITDNIYVRASHGTNFRAEGALDSIPGQVGFTIGTGGATTIGTANTFPLVTTVSNDLSLEDDTTTNLGIGLDYNIGEGRFRASADFFEIVVDGAFSTTTSAVVLSNVFAGQPGAGSLAAQALCTARLRQFVVFTGGNTCTQGVTTGAQIDHVDVVSLNGAGFITNGVDYTLDYSQPLFDGTFSVNLTATNNLVYKFKGYEVNGVVFQPDQNLLGGVNNVLLGGQGSPMQEWRSNLSLRWSNDFHSFNLRANYLSGLTDNRLSALFTPIVNNTAAGTDVFSTYGVSPKEYLDFDFNYIWTPDFWGDLSLRASVLNIADKRPPAYQGSAGYLTGAGDPRGRRIEFSISKKF
jgi:outer membrane receptor protein involved in Fe transport